VREQRAQHPEQLVRVDGLREVTVEPRLARPLSVPIASKGRQRERGHAARRLVQRARPANERVTILARQTDVAEDDVERRRSELGRALLRRADRHDARPRAREDHSHDLPRLRIVLDEQDARALDARRQIARTVARRHAGLHRGHERQRDGERRPLPFAVRMRRDAPAVHLDELARDREADAETACPASRAAVGLAEALEDVRQKTGDDPASRVGDAQYDLGIRSRQGDLDASVGGRELDRVREQVGDDLLQPIGVATDADRAAVYRANDADALPFGRRRERIDRTRDDGTDVDRLQPERHLAGHDAGDVEQVVDQAGPARRRSARSLRRPIRPSRTGGCLAAAPTPTSGARSAASAARAKRPR
jgi:hypothetical protein